MKKESVVKWPSVFLVSIVALILFTSSVVAQEKEVELRVLTYLSGWFNSNSYIERNIPLFEE